MSYQQCSSCKRMALVRKQDCLNVGNPPESDYGTLVPDVDKKEYEDAINAMDEISLDGSPQSRIWKRNAGIPIFEILMELLQERFPESKFSSRVSSKFIWEHNGLEMSCAYPLTWGGKVQAFINSNPSHKLEINVRFVDKIVTFFTTPKDPATCDCNNCTLTRAYEK